MNLAWLGQAAFLVESGNKVAYIDPYEVDSPVKADLILVSHDHYDHCDTDSILRIRREETIVVGPESCRQKLKELQVVSPGDRLNAAGFGIRVVEAYNTNKPMHPRGYAVGYVLEAEGKRVYHAADTDYIPEMNELQNIDLALLPVGGKFTMDSNEAVEAVKAIKPAKAIPMHYGKVVGSRQDAINFKTRVEQETETKVLILNEGQLIQV